MNSTSPRRTVRRAAVVYNPVKVDRAELEAAVERASAAAGWGDTLWLETSIEDTGQHVAEQAVAQGAELVVAAGGDGTVRSVAAGLRDTPAALAIFATGTGNLLARNLALPLNDYPGAAEVAFAGAARPIDVATATITRPDGSREDHDFLVMAGIGLDAAMIADAKPELKRRVGWLAYVDSAFRAMTKLQPVHVRYQLGNRPVRSAHVSTILIANCGSLPGAVELIPDALIDDGRLDIAILQPKNLFGWLQIWRKVTWENRILRKSAVGRRIVAFTDQRLPQRITYLRGSEVKIGTLDGPQEIELDGDPFGEATAAEFTVDERALTVMVPTL